MRLRLLLPLGKISLQTVLAANLVPERLAHLRVTFPQVSLPDCRDPEGPNHSGWSAPIQLLSCPLACLGGKTSSVKYDGLRFLKICGQNCRPTLRLQLSIH